MEETLTCFVRGKLQKGYRQITGWGKKKTKYSILAISLLFPVRSHGFTFSIRALLVIVRTTLFLVCFKSSTDLTTTSNNQKSTSNLTLSNDFLHLLTISNFDKLKTWYLKAQRYQRVDQLLTVILKMEEDSFVKAASTAFGLRQATNRADTMQHHSKGLAIPASDMVQKYRLGHGY